MNSKIHMETDNSLQAIMEISNALRNETDINHLLELILDRAMEIAGCEAGTMYLCDEKYLYFQVIRNKQIPKYNRNRATCDLPPVPMKENYACARALITGEMLMIEDAYETEDEDRQGHADYDEKSGYYTESMMIIPLITRSGEKLGALQLLNALDKDGEYMPFRAEQQPIFRIFADQATIALEQARMKAELEGMRWIISDDNMRTRIDADLLKDLMSYIEKNYVQTAGRSDIEAEFYRKHPEIKPVTRTMNSREEVHSDSFLRKMDGSINEQLRESAIEKLNEYVNESGRRDAAIARDAGIGKWTFHSIVNGKRKASKNNMVAIAVSLGLTTAQIEELLMLNGFCFQPDSKRDLAIRYLFESNDHLGENSKMNLMDFNLVLDRLGYEILGEKSRED